MTSTDFKMLMLGLRGSGKTTFLAAIWHYLELRSPQIGSNFPNFNLIATISIR